ncbi:MAG: energy-coupling factor transporter ATPase [Clostridia bacterium]|nr:energy-coupling factor transporter ATPase [Clostridia bacterium]
MFGRKKKKQTALPQAEIENNELPLSNEFMTFDNVSYSYEISVDDEEVSEGGEDAAGQKDDKNDEIKDGIRYVKALKNVDLTVKRGEFLAVIGRNGSGKSTLAKLMNALLIPSEGTLIVDGIDTSSEDMEWELRSRVGMVFQNPDNQIIGATVEEDIAFGLENMGVPRPEMVERVKWAAETVGIGDRLAKEPSQMSGGQKQRLAIAGILAMRPKCIVLDEATAMLDPVGRREVMKVASMLNKEHGITIVHITHHMDEVAACSRVVVIDNGMIAMSGTPKELFSRPAEMRACGLEVPAVTALAFVLREKGLEIPADIITVDEALPVLADLLRAEALPELSDLASMQKRESDRRESKHPYVFREGPNSVEADGITYSYNSDAKNAHNAIENVSFSAGDGEFIGIIGHTGCGKSTLVQHLNGLLKPRDGSISIGGEQMGGANVKSMRRRVGLVFQYPEYQLFESTVARDVAFGIRNDGLSEEETAKRVDEALVQVGLDPKDVREKSIYDLSGGQKRRVAIAGILVMKPGILVLDEPAAGLDPAGRDSILEICSELNKKNANTVILVSHSMDDVARLCDRVLVMDHGRVSMFGEPADVFENEQALEDMGLTVPQLSKLFHRLNEALPEISISRKIYTVEDAAGEILALTGRLKAEGEVAGQ